MSNYRNEDQEVTSAFKALANPNRLAIFKRLFACCPDGQACDLEDSMCISDIGAELEIAPSTLSHHMKELANAGLVATERQGKNILCRVDLKKVNQLADFFIVTKQ